MLYGARRLGAVLLQYPFWFHNTAENLRRLKQTLDAFGDYPLVIEVRHSSWVVPEFFHFLHEHRAGFCNVDQPLIGRSVKPGEQVTSAIGYVRLHGHRYDTWFSDDADLPSYERYNYLYSEQELDPWVKRIRHVAEVAETTFVVANNHFEAKGVVNASQLIQMLSGER